MEAVVILTCDGFSEILTSNPVSELRRLKILRAVFKSTKELGGEQVYALKMKNGDARDRKSLKMKRRAMKNCKVLGLSAGWIFFIAPSQSLMQLLSIRNLPLHEMTETELCSLLGGEEEVIFHEFFYFSEGPGEIPLIFRMSAKGVSCSPTHYFSGIFCGKIKKIRRKKS